MTNTLLTPTDERMKVDPFDLDDIATKISFDLDDIATEIRCVSSNLFVISSLVKPNDELNDINIMSEKTMQEAFYSIMRNIDGIADRLDDASMRLMQEQKTTATPTDESKDCR